MIGDIIKQIYSQNINMIRQLIEIPIVANCLFRSFDQFTQNIIYRMITNSGQIEKKQFIALMDKNSEYKDGLQRFDATMTNLVLLKIVNKEGFDNPHYRINQNFQLKLNQSIENPQKILGEVLSNQERYDEEYFNLLNLLKTNNPILAECGLSRISGMEIRIKKQNFDFIRLPLGYKISILIRGYLKYKKRLGNPKIIKDILFLCQMKPRRKYKITEKSSDTINELQSIRLVQKIGQNHFIISDYLHNFAFDQTLVEKESLKFSVIIETNFKVYVQIPADNTQRPQVRASNYQLLRNILKCLLKIQHQSYNFDELIVGQIDRQKMKSVFEERITVREYFSFFRRYMKEDLSIEKDLGKWNKIKFLKLEGPSEESMIPNNVKQELKLWESVFHHGDRMDMLNQPDVVDYS